MQCQKKEGANPGELFRAFGPHQQGAVQSLPGTYLSEHHGKQKLQGIY